MPMLEFFDRESIEQFIASQEMKNDRGVRYCSVKTLHNLMMNELNNNLQGSAAATQRNVMIDVSRGRFGDSEWTDLRGA
jgi:hypothetical protein